MLCTTPPTLRVNVLLVKVSERCSWPSSESKKNIGSKSRKVVRTWTVLRIGSVVKNNLHLKNIVCSFSSETHLHSSLLMSAQRMFIDDLLSLSYTPAKWLAPGGRNFHFISLCLFSIFVRFNCSSIDLSFFSAAVKFVPLSEITILSTLRRTVNQKSVGKRVCDFQVHSTTCQTCKYDAITFWSWAAKLGIKWPEIINTGKRKRCLSWCQ